MKKQLKLNKMKEKQLEKLIYLLMAILIITLSVLAGVSIYLLLTLTA